MRSLYTHPVLCVILSAQLALHVLQSMSFWQAVGHAPTLQNGLGIFSQTCTTFCLVHMDSGGGSMQRGLKYSAPDVEVL